VIEYPSFEDALEMRELVMRYLPRTPTWSYPALSSELGCEVFIKHENHQPIGAFKVRGGVSLLASLTAKERACGLVTATRGNHGQSIAYAARLFDTRAVIVVPHGNNPEKNEAMRALGAELVEHGRDFDEACEHAERLVTFEGLRFVHPAEEPVMLAGVASLGIELFEDVPELDYVFVPVGLGSGICGVCLARGSLSPRTRVVGVQALRAPSIYRSWQEKRSVTTESADTFADGLATRVPARLTLEVIQRDVADFVAVGEGAIARAIRDLLRYTHNLAEGAGAAPLAAIRERRALVAGKRVAMIMSGGNIDTATLKRVLDGEIEE
jgi:threonine dehydratase